jgi:hypothetical protein
LGRKAQNCRRPIANERRLKTGVPLAVKTLVGMSRVFDLSTVLFSAGLSDLSALPFSAALLDDADSPVLESDCGQPTFVQAE